MDRPEVVRIGGQVSAELSQHGIPRGLLPQPQSLHPVHLWLCLQDNSITRMTPPSSPCTASYHQRDRGGEDRQPQIPGTTCDIRPELDTTAMVKKAQQRLYFFRLLKKQESQLELSQSHTSTIPHFTCHVQCGTSLSVKQDKGAIL